jgi:hypothetical protein
MFYLDNHVLGFFVNIIVVIVSFFIFLRSKKLFKLTFHKGIHFFSKAFFSYGIAFFVNVMFFLFLIFVEFNITVYLVRNFLNEYFLALAGFLLLCSLLNKWFHKKKIHIGFIAVIIHLISGIIAFFDVIIESFHIPFVSFLFITQIIVSITAMFISFRKYKQSKNNHSFMQIYFITMVLNCIAWIINYIAAMIFPEIRIYVNIITVIMFVSFFIGVLKITKDL